MKILNNLFHFLGGIYCALILITLAAITVAIGTFLESKTGSHLVAAQWTYANPLFFLLLCLFFVNILFSTLRRWPFKKRHLPFLITHLGLLMIIGGTILKNRLGLQGQLSIWEGSGNQHVLLPYTYALFIEEKNSSSIKKSSSVSLDSFYPNIYYPFHFPHLKCKLMGYAPHVKEKLETWIKGSQTYIVGFPSQTVQHWDPSQPLPKESLHFSALDSRLWSIQALKTSHVQEALQQVYLQALTLKIRTKDSATPSIEIPLQQALLEPFSLAQGEVKTSLHLSYFLEDAERPRLNLNWQSQQENYEEKFNISLQGQDALIIQTDPSAWFDSSFYLDLSRPHPTLCLIEDEQDNIFLFAFDLYGRVHGEQFSSTHLQTLVSYDQGFSGYSVQASIPFPTFPSGREDKERAEAHALVQQLQQILVQPSSLAPPLHFFEQACQKAQVDFATTFVQFLSAWNASPGLLFDPVQPLSPALEQVLTHFEWKEVTPSDQQAIQWTSRLLTQLNTSLKQGEHPLDVLEKHHWPFLSELRQLQPILPINVLSQQIAKIIAYLPPLYFPLQPSFPEQAHFLSAYFRIYGIDYRSFFPFHDTKDKEQFNHLEAYWKDFSPSTTKEMQKVLIFETPLTHHLIPDTIPAKLEDQRPGIILEVQQGAQKQVIALAYDLAASGLKWPILNGSYRIRFQPQLKELPYRLRLRQARQIAYPQSPQVYSYESDLLITEHDQQSSAQTLSMNHVYETWDGYRFYLSGVGTSIDASLKHIQLAVNYDPAKYFLTYPGALLVLMGTILLFWIYPSRKH